ncbi:MAG TPA: LysR family transcriptional regulator [Allosphingosinicella sp.]
MSRFPFLHFIPVPVRPRRDGWTPTRQIRFVIGIAKGLSPARAAARIGMTRQSAHALRRHPEGRSFAVAWDAARRFAEERRSREASTPAPRRP